MYELPISSLNFESSQLSKIDVCWNGTFGQSFQNSLETGVKHSLIEKIALPDLKGCCL